MAHSRATGGKATVRPLQTLTNHRELIAAMFPMSVNAATTDAPSDIENKEILHCAASQGVMLSLVGLPSRWGFTYDLPDRFGRTPLHWAAEEGYCDVVVHLLRSQATVDPFSQDKATPIMLAASRGHEDVVEVLLQYNAGVVDRWPGSYNRRGIEYWRSTALHCAAAGGHVKIVEALLDARFDKRQHDRAGLTPVEISARQRHSTSADTTRLLVPLGDVGGKLVYDYVNLANPEVYAVSSLIMGGAFLDWRDETGDTPLHRSMYFEHNRITSMLLREGANPNVRGRLGTCPLHIVAVSGRWQHVPALLQAGADTDLLSVSGDSALHLAVVNNNTDVVRFLLDAGASTEQRDPIHGQTPLSWACWGGLTNLVWALVEAGADVNSRSSAGLTPLHWACRFIDTLSVDILLDAGADPGEVDRAAAKAAVKDSSSRSGMRVPMPIATDVIGLGCPFDHKNHQRLPSTVDSETLAVRRLDLVSVQRIKRKLRDAKQECSWYRRGWLVILANRWVAMGVPGVRGGRAAGCRGCLSPCHQAVMQLQHADTGVEQPPCAHQNRAAGIYYFDDNTNSDSSDSQHQQEELSNGQNVVGKRPRGVVRSVGVVTRASSRRQVQMRSSIGAQANVADSSAGLVDALKGLAALEVGIFRRVVRFI